MNIYIDILVDIDIR